MTRQILKGPQSALLLFEELKLAGQFAEAQKVFQIYQLKDRTQPVTQQQIDQQLEHATEHFLQLPLHLNRVSFIHDLDSLTQAELHFSELNRAGAPIIVAVDVEWRDFDDTNGITGASILQIATGADVFIVDFLADWTDTRSSSKTRLKTFLSMIFGRKDIIKIGWDFGSSDIKQLRASANGYFSGCFDSSTIESVVDLNRAIKILYDAELLPTVKPSLEMGKKHGALFMILSY